MTPAGIELATFRFLAHHLNQCATVVAHWLRYYRILCFTRNTNILLSTLSVVINMGII